MAPVGRWGQRLLSTSHCQTPVEQPSVVNIRISPWFIKDHLLAGHPRGRSHSTIPNITIFASCWPAKLQPNHHHHQQTNTQLFTGRTPFPLPDKQCQITKGQWYHILQTCSPQSHLGSSILVWLPEAPTLASHQPSDASSTPTVPHVRVHFTSNTAHLV